MSVQQKRFVDKAAIVTGGGSGIGRAAAMLFAREGAAVVVVSIAEQELNEACEEITAFGGRCLAVTADLTKESEVKRMVAAARKAFGEVDILVNSAGTTIEYAVVDMSTEIWDRVQDINLKACFLCCREVLGPMIARNSGKIVNVASICSKLSAVFSHGAAYCSSKAAALSLTASIAAEVKPYNINVNAVLPARTNTAMFRKYHPNFEDVTGLMEPEDIAKVIAFLCSDDARAIKGAPIEVTNAQELQDWDGAEAAQ